MNINENEEFPQKFDKNAGEDRTPESSHHEKDGVNGRGKMKSDKKSHETLNLGQGNTFNGCSFVVNNFDDCKEQISFVVNGSESKVANHSNNLTRQNLSEEQQNAVSQLKHYVRNEEELMELVASIISCEDNDQLSMLLFKELVAKNHVQDYMLNKQEIINPVLKLISYTKGATLQSIRRCNKRLLPGLVKKR